MDLLFRNIHNNIFFNNRRKFNLSFFFMSLNNTNTKHSSPNSKLIYLKIIIFIHESVSNFFTNKFIFRKYLTHRLIFSQSNLSSLLTKDTFLIDRFFTSNIILNTLSFSLSVINQILLILNKNDIF